MKLPRTSGLRAPSLALTQFRSMLEASASLEVVWTTPARFWAAWEMLAVRDDKRWSLTDCLSFVTMESFGNRSAFSFDTDFAQAGFDLLPSVGRRRAFGPSVEKAFQVRPSGRASLLSRLRRRKHDLVRPRCDECCTAPYPVFEGILQLRIMGGRFARKAMSRARNLLAPLTLCEDHLVRRPRRRVEPRRPVCGPPGYEICDQVLLGPVIEILPVQVGLRTCSRRALPRPEPRASSSDAPRSGA